MKIIFLVFQKTNRKKIHKLWENVTLTLQMEKQHKTTNLWNKWLMKRISFGVKSKTERIKEKKKKIFAIPRTFIRIVLYFCRQHSTLAARNFFFFLKEILLLHIQRQKKRARKQKKKKKLARERRFNGENKSLKNTRI